MRILLLPVQWIADLVDAAPVPPDMEGYVN